MSVKNNMLFTWCARARALVLNALNLLSLRIKDVRVERAHARHSETTCQKRAGLTPYVQPFRQAEPEQVCFAPFPVLKNLLFLTRARDPTRVHVTHTHERSAHVHAHALRENICNRLLLDAKRPASPLSSNSHYIPLSNRLHA